VVGELWSIVTGRDRLRRRFVALRPATGPVSTGALRLELVAAATFGGDVDLWVTDQARALAEQGLQQLAGSLRLGMDGVTAGPGGQTYHFVRHRPIRSSPPVPPISP
jgi:hypothetical protein